jgi:hypothetical protein
MGWPHASILPLFFGGLELVESPAIYAVLVLGALTVALLRVLHML